MKMMKMIKNDENDENDNELDNIISNKIFMTMIIIIIK